MDKHYLFKEYQEFIIFLLIHIGNADYTLTGPEIEVILSKMEDYFPDVDEMDTLRNKFIYYKDEYEEMNDTDINHLIYDNYLKFRDQQINSQRILNDLQEVIMADGLIHDKETKTFESIKKLLDMNE
jgi:uncharacterized tellurite resistance protein B-like protein